MTHEEEFEELVGSDLCDRCHDYPCRCSADGDWGDSMPESCAPGLHKPAIVHRCGGKDAAYWNFCGVCGQQIQRGDGEPWCTEEQVEEFIAEQRTEAEQEQQSDDYNETGANRCPPRS